MATAKIMHPKYSKKSIDDELEVKNKSLVLLDEESMDDGRVAYSTQDGAPPEI